LEHAINDDAARQSTYLGVVECAAGISLWSQKSAEGHCGQMHYLLHLWLPFGDTV
jgi:hypothetical protein